MDDRGWLLLLGLGLCITACHANLPPVKVYGSNPHEDVPKRLESLMAEKQRLERLLAQPHHFTRRRVLDKELQNVNDLIHRLQTSAKVSYKDYLEMMAMQEELSEERAKQHEYCEKAKALQKEQFETDMAALRKQLSNKDNHRVDSNDAKRSMHKKQQEDIAIYEHKINELEKAKDKIVENYEADLALLYEQHDMTVKDNYQLVKEKKEMAQKIKRLQEELKQKEELNKQRYNIETDHEAKSALLYEQQETTVKEKHQLLKERHELLQKIERLKKELQEKEKLKEERDKIVRDCEENTALLQEEHEMTAREKNELVKERFGMLQKINRLKEEVQEKVREEREKLKRDYEAKIALVYEQQEVTEKEKNQLAKERDELLQKMERMKEELKEELREKKDKIVKDYEAKIALLNEQQEKLEQEKNRLIMKNGELMIKLKQLIGDKDKIAKDYKTETELLNKRQAMMEKEKSGLVKERGKMMQELKKAQNLHSQAIEAIAEATEENCSPALFPYEDDIKEWRRRINTFVKTNNEMQLLRGLPAMQMQLEEFLQKLYMESKLSAETPLERIEKSVRGMAVKKNRERDQEVERRKDLLKKLLTKDFADYDEKDITSLRKANQAVAISNKSVREVARQEAYLKGISQLVDLRKDLIQRCSDAIRHSHCAGSNV